MNPALNAIVAMFPREALLAQARAGGRADRARRGRGRSKACRSAVKDLEDCAGLITSHGSVPYKDNLATHDSVQVERLRAAGAIPIGKSNAPEFGVTAITKNLVFGVTRSPWSADRTPGGSSGGSAAALASCMVPLVTASDGGGSTRIPASFVGAFGLKPTYGRIPSEPKRLWYYGDTAVHGPLTKTVADNALYLDVTGGYDRRDPKSLPHPGFSYRAKLAEGVPKKLRIGYSPDLGYAVVQSDIAAGGLRRGARVREARPHGGARSRAARRSSASRGACGARSRWPLRTCTCCPSTRTSSRAACWPR